MKAGQFYVFSLKDEVFVQVSIGFDSFEEANSFVITMKDADRYRSTLLIVTEVKSVTV